jgi:hypothetical protein
MPGEHVLQVRLIEMRLIAQETHPLAGSEVWYNRLVLGAA